MPASTGPVMRIVLAIQGITDSGSRVLLWSPITPQTDIPFGTACWRMRPVFR